MTPTNDWQGGRVQILRLFHADGSITVEFVEEIELVPLNTLEAQLPIFDQATTLLTLPDARLMH
jgi:hypothetical protein